MQVLQIRFGGIQERPIQQTHLLHWKWRGKRRHASFGTARTSALQQQILESSAPSESSRRFRKARQRCRRHHPCYILPPRPPLGKLHVKPSRSSLQLATDPSQPRFRGSVYSDCCSPTRSP